MCRDRIQMSFVISTCFFCTFKIVRILGGLSLITVTILFEYTFSLSGLSEVDEESIKETRSVRDLFMLLQEKKLFTKTDVIFMQYLLKQTDCKILYDKCIEYAREQGALCFFEKPPGIVCMNNALHAL